MNEFTHWIIQFTQRNEDAFIDYVLSYLASVLVYGS